MRCQLTALILIILASLPGHVVAQNIEIVLGTDGDVSFNGTKGPAKVSSGEILQPGQESLVKQNGTPEEVKIFTTPSDAQKNKQHGKLGIEIPDRSVVSLRAQQGDVSLSNLDASVSGTIQSGTLSISNQKGYLELSNEGGDIIGNEIESRGLLIARKGSIRLTDVTGNLTTYAPEGQVSISVSPSYYKKYPVPLDIGLERGDIEIASVPFGGMVRIGRGSIRASGILQPFSIQADSADIVLTGVAAPVSLRSRGAASLQLLTFGETGKSESDLPVDIEIEDGELTLELAAGFSGVLQLWATDINPQDKSASFASTLDLGKARVSETTSEDGRTSVRQTTYQTTIGKGGPTVRAHVTNGKVIVK